MNEFKCPECGCTVDLEYFVSEVGVGHEAHFQTTASEECKKCGKSFWVHINVSLEIQRMTDGEQTKHR